MTTEEDGNTLDGTPPERFAPELERRGAHVIGVNCSVGPAPMLETIERMAARRRALRLSAQPNAGQPRDVEGRNIYLCSPEYMASYARRFILHNVRLVGGCCGTTPEHIRQIKAAVARGVAPGAARRAVRSAPAPRRAAGARRRRRRCRASRSRGWRTRWRAARSSSPSNCCRRAATRPTRSSSGRARSKIRGVDVVNIPDGPRAGARMSALSLAVLVEQQAGIETVLHYACRDRNLLGIQSDLLGAHAMGLRNLLLVTGDPGRVGDYPDATAVFDVDSIGLTNVVARLNRGLRRRRPADRRADRRFTSASSSIPTAPDLDDELRRFEYKVEAGAEFVVTQPVFDVAAFDTFLERTSDPGCRSSPGCFRSTACATRSSWPTRCPASGCPRRCSSGCGGRAPEAAAAEGVAIAREIAAEFARSVQGVQISGPPAAVLRVIDGL